ncbi:alpha/beta-hydrolase [Mollisia scopiformis]|uniref:Alpha/beta-hydrolase n=1 Tax=Mollisia scopiformis TaxID=149040 RepID=A0A132BAF0_MOLSC|nr:alpha/beta-hydrolase [Mollisia scopiformis]KUJ09385.1 alpha/beta-hydrolase [Mollisia scopiformis]
MMSFISFLALHGAFYLLWLWPHTPFELAVKPEIISLAQQKAGLTRDGPPVHSATSVRDYWTNEYNWTEVQNDINTRFKMYTTTVNALPNSNYNASVPLHFVHHRSNRTDAIPLLFVHGWPGSFLEVANLLEPLTNPPNSSIPAFHVVAPSIPGFGFSPAPLFPLFGPRAAGEAFNNLMHQLNYTSYVVQGGDIGGFITRFMASSHPESVVSMLNNFWLIQPNATDFGRYFAGNTTADENYVIEEFWNFENKSSGYRFEQQTQPLQIGHAMTDSPVGFAMYIYDFMFLTVDDYWWGAGELITWTLMYWIQGPYAGFRFYKEMVNDYVVEDGLLINSTTFPYVSQPVAISEFPADIWYRTPLDWAQRGGNVVARTVHEFGGHFAAVETPDLLIEDIRSFFGSSTLSNTSIFSC